MTITDIIEHDKKKVFVQVDCSILFPMYKNELTKYHLRKEAEIPREVYTQIMEELLPKRAKLRAMHLLQKRTYTKMMLRKKLLEGRYPECIVEEAIEYVASYGYVDDMRYTLEYIRCYCESRSQKRIFQDLFAKGIDKDTATRAWDLFEEENMPVDEEKQIKALLQKKHFDAAKADRKETAKVINFLCRKGYSMDSIFRCIRVDEIY